MPAEHGTANTSRTTDIKTPPVSSEHLLPSQDLETRQRFVFVRRTIENDLPRSLMLLALRCSSIEEEFYHRHRGRSSRCLKVVLFGDFSCRSVLVVPAFMLALFHAASSVILVIQASRPQPNMMYGVQCIAFSSLSIPASHVGEAKHGCHDRRQMRTGCRR
jgi:hypothetical protein